MGNSPVNILHITDTHLLGDKESTLLGVKTVESFQAVINLIKSETIKFDFIIHSGDLSQDASEASYRYIAEKLSQFNVPIYCMPGNHDDVQVMGAIYPYQNMLLQHHIVLKNWHIILLDSKKPHAVEGYLDQTQLNYLQHCLKAFPEHHALISLHHQPIPVGSNWLDNVGLKNANEFWDIVLHYPKVNTILFGHIHQEFLQIQNNIKCIATPSTCIQFKPHHDKFVLDKLPPGYRILQLYDDGSLETELRRTTEYVGYFDKHAKGY